MSGLLGSLHTASSGMRANQTVIQTINHNINNLNTPGYSRQRAELTTNSAYTRPGRTSSPMYAGQLGQGVSVSNITRIRNSFYDYHYRSESHSYGNVAIKVEHYNNIENVFNEPSDTSISSSLNTLFNSFNELSKDPNFTSAKKYVVENAKILASSINQVNQKLNRLQTNIASQEEGIITDINNILKELELLEKDIKIIEATGKNPNDLLDRKDNLIDELSFKLNINDADVQIILADGQLTPDELAGLDVSGELQAVRDMQDEINNIIGQVDTLINAIADGVNNIYKNDPTAPDTKDFFVVGKDANGLTTISVNKDFVDDATSLVMSSDKALALSNLKSTKLTINGENITLSGFYNNIVQDIGYASQAVSREEANRSSLLVSIENSKASISGVSLDEEMINLMQFQHAYSATAKVASTVDSLLDVVINGLIK